MRTTHKAVKAGIARNPAIQLWMSNGWDGRQQRHRGVHWMADEGVDAVRDEAVALAHLKCQAPVAAPEVGVRPPE